MGDERFSNVLPRLKKLHAVIAAISSLHILISLPYIFPKSFLGCGKVDEGNPFSSAGRQQATIASVSVGYVIFNTLLYRTNRLHPRWLWISSLIGMLYWALAAISMSLSAILIVVLMANTEGRFDCGTSRAKCLYCMSAIPFLWAAVLWPIA